jgi:uncharacterized protein YjbI with pentapeptide repeats
MGDLTRDQVLLKLRKNEKLDRADLRGLDLSKAPMTGASLSRADLEGANLEAAVLRRANLKNANLREAYLAGSDLAEANLENADLEGAKLDRANLAGANLARANLDGATLTGANLAGAQLSFAQVSSANLTGADLRGAILTHANFEESTLGAVKAIEADLRAANLRGATLTKADLTGAKVAGLIGTGRPLGDVLVSWLDTSEAGDGTGRITNGEIPGLLSGLRAQPGPTAPASRRYFGRGDVLKNATLEFEAGARIEIDSLFENCAINLGEGTELVVGKGGVLADCTISGAGSITVNGQFFERESPGIVGPRELVVTSGGALVASVMQNEKMTRFAFEKESRLRLKIVRTDVKGG